MTPSFQEDVATHLVSSYFGLPRAKALAIVRGPSGEPWLRLATLAIEQHPGLHTRSRERAGPPAGFASGGGVPDVSNGIGAMLGHTPGSQSVLAGGASVPDVSMSVVPGSSGMGSAPATHGTQLIGKNYVRPRSRRTRTRTARWAASLKMQRHRRERLGHTSSRYRRVGTFEPGAFPPRRLCRQACPEALIRLMADVLKSIEDDETTSTGRK